MMFLRTYGPRLLWAIGLSVSSIGLLFFGGDKSVVPLAFAAAVLLSVPFILLAPLTYGPRGLGARMMGDRWHFPSWATKLVPGLVIFGCGFVLLGHFKSDPSIANMGALIVIFGIETMVTNFEFTMNQNARRFT